MLFLTLVVWIQPLGFLYFTEFEFNDEWCVTYRYIPLLDSSISPVSSSTTSGAFCRPPLITQRSTFDTQRSILDTHRSTLTPHRSPLTAHRSLLTAHRSPLTAQRSTLNTQRSTLAHQVPRGHHTNDQLRPDWLDRRPDAHEAMQHPLRTQPALCRPNSGRPPSYGRGDGLLRESQDEITDCRGSARPDSNRRQGVPSSHTHPNSSAWHHSRQRLSLAPSCPRSPCACFPRARSGLPLATFAFA